MGNFFTKGPDYFALFETGIGYSVKAAEALQSAFNDGVINRKEIDALKEIEHQGDKHVHQCITMVAEAFITPIDRADLMTIVQCIESVTDSIDSAANQVYMMHINVASESARKFVDLLVQACHGLGKLMTDFKDFKKNVKDINETIILVNHIEEEGDDLYKESMRALFDPAKEVSPVDIIRMQNLYNALEDMLDCCEDVADAVSDVIIANT